MKLTSYAITDVGRQRNQNQDYVFSSEVAIGPLPNLFIVADGMGGHKAGEFASKCAVETVVNSVNLGGSAPMIKVLTRAINEANKRVRQKSLSDDEFSGMGTTLVLCCLDDDGLTVANIGDSRLYVIGSGGIKQVTTDHSYVEEMVRMGELERRNARLHPDKNIITRAVGVMDSVDADFFEVEDIHAGDTVLMCSDGLSNMLEDTEIEGIVSGQGTIEEKARRLVAAANMNGGRDNIAVILVQIEVEK
jgi:protein phosphatase